MKALVVYYSNKGRSRYLAQKISESLACDLEEIRPRLNALILFLMSINLGIKPLKNNINEYENVILCGPIWMGRLIPPLRNFLLRYGDCIQNLGMALFTKRLQKSSGTNVRFTRPFLLI
jgi:menaquinone-dependent protoporphyrinogen IX oxidase